MVDPRMISNTEGEGSGPLPNTIRGRAVQGGEFSILKTNPNEGDEDFERREGANYGLDWCDEMDEMGGGS